MNFRQITLAYLGSTVVIVTEELINTASLITETSREGLSVIGSTCYITKGIFRAWNKDVYRISEDVLNSLDRQVESYLRVHSVDCVDEGRHFSVHSESYLVQYFCLCPSAVEVPDATTYTPQSIALFCCWTHLETRIQAALSLYIAVIIDLNTYQMFILVCVLVLVEELLGTILMKWSMWTCLDYSSSHSTVNTDLTYSHKNIISVHRNKRLFARSCSTVAHKSCNAPNRFICVNDNDKPK
jgi:hypothetical protein